MGGGGGALQNGRGDKFTPTKKGADTVLTMLKREGTTRFGAVLTQELEVLAILKGRKKFPLFKH